MPAATLTATSQTKALLLLQPLFASSEGEQLLQPTTAALQLTAASCCSSQRQWAPLPTDNSRGWMAPLYGHLPEAQFTVAGARRNLDTVYLSSVGWRQKWRQTGMWPWTTLKLATSKKKLKGDMNTRATVFWGSGRDVGGFQSCDSRHRETQQNREMKKVLSVSWGSLHSCQSRTSPRNPTAALSSDHKAVAFSNVQQLNVWLTKL